MILQTLMKVKAALEALSAQSSGMKRVSLCECRFLCVISASLSAQRGSYCQTFCMSITCGSEVPFFRLLR